MVESAPTDRPGWWILPLAGLVTVLLFAVIDGLLPGERDERLYLALIGAIVAGKAFVSATTTPRN